MKSTIPRFALVLCLLAFAQIANAQDHSNPDSNNKVNPVAQQATLPELVRRVKPSVVSVLTYDAKGEPLISGSGFFVRSGEVVTNMHVIKGAHRVEIHTLLPTIDAGRETVVVDGEKIYRYDSRTETAAVGTLYPFVRDSFSSQLLPIQRNGAVPSTTSGPDAGAGTPPRMTSALPTTGITAIQPG